MSDEFTTNENGSGTPEETNFQDYTAPENEIVQNETSQMTQEQPETSYGATSALDPISTLKIEDLMEDLKKKYTVVVVTHNMQQAARVSDETAFFLVGEVVEKDITSNIFARPKDKRTEDYITGRFG